MEEESQFTLKQHHKFLAVVIAEAKKANKTKVRIPLRQTAQIYDFTNLLRDEEEMEFVLDDIMMELSEMTVIDETGEVLPACGIEKLDYPGGRHDLEVTIDPQLKYVTNFRLGEAAEE